jgi:hypothetical protein
MSAVLNQNYSERELIVLRKLLDKPRVTTMELQDAYFKETGEERSLQYVSTTIRGMAWKLVYDKLLIHNHSGMGRGNTGEYSLENVCTFNRTGEPEDA